MKRKIKVLIVDDSAFMRKSLSIMLSRDANLEIIGTAKNGKEGYDLAKSLHPDIITLDVEMPVMDGLTALKLIMKDAPTSVIMVSSITTEGAESTLKAFEYGAIDFISKEQSFVSVNITNIKDELIRKIKSIVYHKWNTASKSSSTLNKSSSQLTSIISKGTLPNIRYNAIALGVSTGGPISLQKVIPLLSENLNVPIFIVQHMPPKFTKSLADRLDGMSKLTVKEAEHGDLVAINTVYIAPGGKHINFVKMGSSKKIILTDEPTSLHRPSVDVMFHSALAIYGKNMLGVIMTGMGKDGLEGITELKKIGGNCLAQNESSCIVYGMPKAIVDAGFADAIVPLDQIANKINMVFK
jgi:two-component system, chemotaxis family, protein-glutamate methylesterase/glutaminase